MITLDDYNASLPTWQRLDTWKKLIKKKSLTTTFSPLRFIKNLIDLCYNTSIISLILKSLLLQTIVHHLSCYHQYTETLHSTHFTEARLSHILTINYIFRFITWMFNNSRTKSSFLTTLSIIIIVIIIAFTCLIMLNDSLRRPSFLCHFLFCLYNFHGVIIVVVFN